MVVIITHRISRKGYNRSERIHICTVPHRVLEDLFRTVRACKISVALGFEKILLKDNLLKCHFVPNHESPYFQSETFNRILE